MITSLQIKNYRNLKNLKLDSLDQINLITGKNNTGKTSLLEAVAIYANQGSLNLLSDLMRSHGEYFREMEVNTAQVTSMNISALSSLFYDRVVGFEAENAITIGEGESSLVTIKFVKYGEKVEQDTAGTSMMNRRFMIDDLNEDNLDDYKTGLYIASAEKKQLISMERSFFPIRTIGGSTNAVKLEFLKTGYIDLNNNDVLFDKIALTDKEQYVIEALKIIEPDTERIAFVSKGSKERFAVIKLSKQDDILPLKSMGDGINRILSIILALVNCENGFLLIDEFENGLHYTVQEQLWKIIFKLAKQLNIQVFITTHSEDCISSFEQVLNDSRKKIGGKLIRLDNINGVIKQTEFSPKELKIANEQDIELR